MNSLAALELGVLIAVFLTAGAVVLLRSDLTRYHVPVILLALFTLTGAVMIPVGAETIRTDAEEIDYRVEAQSEGCQSGVDGRATEFTELSPTAQEVFLSALRSEDTYTTTARPDEYEISTDTTRENHVEYESDCYSLVGYSGGGVQYGILLNLLFVVGIPVIVGLGVLSAFSYRNRSFRAPSAVVSGLTVLIGLHTVVGLRALLPMSALVAAAVWVLLDGFEPLRE